MIKKQIHSIINKLGYQLHKKDKRLRIGYTKEYLSSLCQPDLVIDVGVATGTHSLYEAFPEASFLLVEPLVEEYAAALTGIQEQYDCELVAKALGEEVSSSVIEFDGRDLEKASLFERTSLTENKGPITRKTIEVTTLDSLLQNKDINSKSVLLKIDTEGGELSVLKGATQVLPFIEFVIAEVSLAKRFEGSYEFEELIAFMDTNGFKVFSFLTMPFHANEQRQRFTDILFQRVG